MGIWWGSEQVLKYALSREFNERAVKKHIDQLVPFYGDKSDTVVEKVADPIPIPVSPGPDNVQSPTPEKASVADLASSMSSTPRYKREMPTTAKRGVPPVRLDL